MLGVGTVIAPPVGADVAVAEVADGTEVAEVAEPVVLGAVVTPPVGADADAAEVAGATDVAVVAGPVGLVELGVDAASSPEQAAARAMTTAMSGSASATSRGR